MKVAIIDADLVGRDKHRFPNLVCMKISAYHKNIGNDVTLKMDYEDLEVFDKVYISKVFVQTEIPGEPKDKSDKNESTVIEWYKDNLFLKQPNIEYGGTGFFYDKAPKLPSEIEHQKPDYHLYDEWVNSKLSEVNEKTGKPKYKRVDFKYYLDYSIGFVTRGCFRGCEFCVNRNCKKVEQHSPLDEFVDYSRPKICLLDDNFFGCPAWKTILNQLQATKKPFQFKQGLDERLLTEEKCELLFKSKYDGDYIFAFDNVADAELIERKLKLIREYTDKIPKFYTFCGFDRNDKWDEDFWKQDLWDIWKRIEILMKYQCLPYIMRHESYEKSPYRGTYINLAAWCNQPSAFKKKSYREFVEYQQSRHPKECSETRYLKQIESEMPDLAEKYFDMKFMDFSD